MVRMRTVCPSPQAIETSGNADTSADPHHPLLVGRSEAELRVETVHVVGPQQPERLRVRPELDGHAHELEAKAAAAVLVEDVHVVQERDLPRLPVRDTREADLHPVEIEADEARRVVVQTLLLLSRPPRRPVGVGQERGDRVEIDALAVVVELVAPLEDTSHAESVLRRKPPCSSYDARTTARHSRAARSESSAAVASAGGRRSSASIPTSPAIESGSAWPAQPGQTTPP